MTSPFSWRALIVSQHPVFGDGLGRLLVRQTVAPVELLGRVTSLEAAGVVVEAEQPNLVIVDCDDAALNREACLARFIVEGERRLRLVLVSLKETGLVVLYDRRSLAGSQVEDWLGEVLPPAAWPAPSGGELL